MVVRPPLEVGSIAPAAYGLLTKAFRNINNKVKWEAPTTDEKSRLPFARTFGPASGIMDVPTNIPVLVAMVGLVIDNSKPELQVTKKNTIAGRLHDERVCTTQ